jgi:hypothetical protein
MPSGPRCAQPQTHWCHVFLRRLPATLLMAWGWSSMIVCVLFVSLFCLYVSREPRYMKVSRRPDTIASCLHLFAFVGPVERCGLENFGSPWHAVAADFQNF